MPAAKKPRHLARLPLPASTEAIAPLNLGTSLWISPMPDTPRQPDFYIITDLPKI